MTGGSLLPTSRIEFKTILIYTFSVVWGMNQDTVASHVVLSRRFEATFISERAELYGCKIPWFKVEIIFTNGNRPCSAGTAAPFTAQLLVPGCVVTGAGSRRLNRHYRSLLAELF